MLRCGFGKTFIAEKLGNSGEVIYEQAHRSYFANYHNMLLLSRVD